MLGCFPMLLASLFKLEVLSWSFVAKPGKPRMIYAHFHGQGAVDISKWIPLDLSQGPRSVMHTAWIQCRQIRAHVQSKHQHPAEWHHYQQVHLVQSILLVIVWPFWTTSSLLLIALKAVLFNTRNKWCLICLRSTTPWSSSLGTRTTQLGDGPTACTGMYWTSTSTLTWWSYISQLNVGDPLCLKHVSLTFTEVSWCGVDLILHNMWNQWYLKWFSGAQDPPTRQPCFCFFGSWVLSLWPEAQASLAARTKNLAATMLPFHPQEAAAVCMSCIGLSSTHHRWNLWNHSKWFRLVRKMI